MPTGGQGLDGSAGGRYSEQPATEARGALAARGQGESVPPGCGRNSSVAHERGPEMEGLAAAH